MIKIVPVIDDINNYQRGDLPSGAVKMKAPASTNEMMAKAAPIAAILCVVLAAAMFLKTYLNHGMVVSLIGIIIGVVIGILLLTVHELLHAAVYPKDAAVTVGKLKGKPVFAALASYPLARKRFILMCLLPFLLGIIPLAVFIFSAPENLTLNGVMLGLAYIGMVSPYPDVYNVILVMKQSNASDKIMFYGDDIYKIIAN